MTRAAESTIERKARMKHVGVFPFEFDDAGGDEENVAIPRTIHLLPIGQWDHNLYGPILINASDIREFIQNFNAGIRKGVFITAGHEGMEELPAVGWITQVEARDTGLWGVVEWNEEGKKLLTTKAFKFFSPEFCREYEDQQTHQIYRNVLTGGALTKAPYFKELQAVVFSEKNIKTTFNETMDLQTVLAKKVEELSAEEKAFIKDHASELTEEQKTAFTAVIDEAETDEQKEAREKKEAEDAAAKSAAEETAKGDANEAAGLNRDGSAKGDVSASEGGKKTIMMSEGEVKALRAQADQGAQAFAELKKAKIEKLTNELVFSESNKVGRFLPKSLASVKSFMESLNEAQQAKFSALIAELPKAQLFTELGTNAAAAEGTAKAELEAKIKVKMSENKEVKYSEALKQVFAESPDLTERYNKEISK